METMHEQVLLTVNNHSNVYNNIPRCELIKEAVANGEARPANNGALAVWTPKESTGRSPADTVIVKRTSSKKTIDWSSENNIDITEETFNMIFEDAIFFLKHSKKIYVTDRVLGADSRYALPVKTITNHALTSVFTDNMFRQVPDDIQKSIFADKPFTLLSIPYEKLDKVTYHNRLRRKTAEKTSDMVIAMDLDRRIGIIIGSAYCGSCKKLMFTVMNYYLPFEGILPLHCSANEGPQGDSALLLGLSGTGKTTLSVDNERLLLGDDEHGWSTNGIANFEQGCYAKMININPQKEPDIYTAVMHQDEYENHGVIIENAMIFPNGKFDFNDARLTQNSRASYPLKYLKNIKESSISTHPKTIFFLTADAYGVLPPISKLDKNQAMLWFLMGYTSKLAGTETGVTRPKATFSRFFGAPFMPCLPQVYAQMLGEKMETYNSSVYLLNTGWIGGSYPIGKRIDIAYTRAMLNAALHGELDNVEYTHNSLFHVNIPVICPEVPTEILNPINTWKNPAAYEKTALTLAKKFSDHFDKAFAKYHLGDEIKSQCPGK